MLRKLILTLSAILLFSSLGFARPNKQLLSSVGSLGPTQVAIPQSFEGEIRGSVSLMKSECKYTLTNTSEKITYRFSVNLEETNANGKTRSVTGGSYKLKPGQSDERSAKIRAKTIGCALWISRIKDNKKDIEGEEGSDDAESSSENKPKKNKNTYKRNPSTISTPVKKPSPATTEQPLIGK